jgi:hypothetical protein
MRRSEIDVRPDWAPVVVALLYVATRLPFLHAGGSPDGDAVQIALGVMQGSLDGSGVGASRAYGVPFSRGAYEGLLAFAPLFGRDPAALFACMNLFGLAFGLLGQIAVWGLLRALWGPTAAVFGSILWLFAPGWWELNTYGHPTPLAFSLLVTALWILAGGARPRPQAGRVAAASIAYACAVAIRTDTLIYAAAFPALGMWRAGGVRGAALGLVPAVAAGAAALLLSPHGRAAGAPHALDLVRRAVALVSPSTAILARKLITLALGVGVISALAIPVGAIAAMRHRLFFALALAGVGALPALFLWLQIEGPYRHLLGASFFLLLPLAARTGRWSRKRAVAAGLAIAVANQLGGAWIGGALLERAPFGYRAVEGERRWTWRVPIGDWFSNHRAAVRGVRREAETAGWIAGAAPPRLLVLAQSPYRAELELIARYGPYPIEQRFADPALWVTHRPPGRTIVFLLGDPPYVRSALARVTPPDSLAGYAILVPRGQQPIQAFVPPLGTHSIAPPVGSVDTGATAR